LYGVTVINQSDNEKLALYRRIQKYYGKRETGNICLVKKLNLEVRGDTLLIENAAVIK
jgi:hypothetical protein